MAAAGAFSRLSTRLRSHRVWIAGLIAVVLAVVGTVSGVALGSHKNHQDQASLHPISAGRATPSPIASLDPKPAATRAPEAEKSPTEATAVSAVAPLRNRVDPDLFLTSPTTLTAAQVAGIARVTDAKRLLQVDFAQVKLDQGITTAVGVDPSTFRAFTPANTAPVDALWAQVADGDVAVAHAVGEALQVKLGGYTTIGRVVQKAVRVGAFATSRLPGVGLVVDQDESAALGLIKGAALIIVLPAGADPIVAATAAQLLMPKVKVQSLRYAVQDGLPASGTSHNPTVPGGIPILGNGWTIPLALGTYTLTQRFHYPNGHPGIDLAAPFGTPIYAAAEGDVLYWGAAQGFGNWIVLQHPGGIQTVYGHMRRDELLIGPTAHVKAGQLIARVGSEGESTGPHLHFEVRVDNVRVDPIAFLNAHGVTEIH